MRRREFIALLGVGAGWPLAARGQQPERVRLIGVLVGSALGDQGNDARLEAFQERLQQLGYRRGAEFPLFSEARCM
jgi:putative tryptophan/tyrosine transport system substrate-binding protein